MSTVREWKRTLVPRVGPTRVDSPGAASTTGRVTPRWPSVILVALCAIAILAGVLELGPPTAASTRDRIVTAQKGVVQSTVSGSGTLQPTTTTNVNFRTSGQLSHVYVSEGQSVGSGQVLGDLDASAARAAVDEAQANLTSANAKLDQARSEPISSTASTTLQQTTAAIATAARTAPSGTTTSGAQQTTGSKPTSG
ncbi:MAG: hypothetical protein QOK04_2579, partial [Solirubrobacteraceae bacterium]|nr:hypothetical protein [Solirubrobacteraceae bacterium]